MSSKTISIENYRETYDRLKNNGRELPVFALTEKSHLFQAIGHPQHKPSSQQERINLALMYLEMGFSPKWLYPTMCHKVNKNLDSSVVAIPVLIDASYVIGLLHENLSPIITNAFVQVVDKSRNKATGLLNYILWDGDAACCDDTDTTSVTFMALLQSKKICFAEAQTMGIRMLEICQKDKNGVLGNYLPKNEETQTTLLHQAAWGKSHTDVGVILNMLWFLGFLQLDSRPEVGPSLNLLDNELNRLLSTGPSENPRENFKFYTNTDVVIFLFSQFITTAGSNNRIRFEPRLKQLVKKRIESMYPELTNCLAMSCLILAAFYLELEAEPEVKTKIVHLVKKIVSQQDLTDGKFPNYCLYEWVKVGYFGSQYITTAFALKAILVAIDKFGADVDQF